MPLTFKSSPSMTLGVELELQIIDARSKDLVAGSPKIFAALGGEQEHIKSELVQAMIEINTGICKDVGQVRVDLQKQIAVLQELTESLGVELAGAGSHPFARYNERLIFPSERYDYLIDRVRWIARRLMVFGLHVHVGMRDAEHAMAMINAMLHYMPHLLGLSASSPFWQGADTGLASCRVTIFEALPTAGHPCTFESWKEFEDFYDAMIRSKSISSIKDLWWDIRPHPEFGTVELRVCDGLPTLEETLSLVALVQSLYAWFDQEYQNGRRFQAPPYWILRENKWKASRYGLDADIILDESGRTSPLKKEVEQLIRKLEPFAAALNAKKELLGLSGTLETGGSHVRQKRVYERDGTFVSVAELLIEEFRTQKPLR